MKKFNKLIALFAALCMLVTLFSGMTAFADDETAGETPAALAYYWDADHDFVSVDFEEAITQDSLSRIKLFLNGAEVPATVAFSLHASAGTVADIDEGRATRYTYLITPDNGAIALDTIYTLKLTNVTGAKTERSVTDEVFFKVTKLSDIIVYSSGSNSKTAWRTNNDKTGNAVISSNENGISVTQSSSNYTSINHALGKDSLNDSTLKDYTVKMTYNVSDADRYGLRLAALCGNHGIDYDGLSFKGIYLNLQNSNDSATGATIEDKKAVYLFENQYINAREYQYTNRDAHEGWDDDTIQDGITLKISAKDGFARGYVNGKKVADMELFADEKANYGGVVAGVRSYSATTAAPKTVVMKDFLATQAVEVNLTPEVITPLWDADSDFISLTFDKEMPLDALKSIITLKKNGVPVSDLSVELNRHASTDAANKTLSTKLSTKYTYTITPQEEMELGAIYTLSVDGKFPGENGTKMYTFDFEKYFKVEKLDSGMQYASLTNNAWDYAGGNKTNIDTVTYDSESDSLVITFEPATAWQNGMYYRHYPEYSAFDESLKDYTVKLTITPGENASATQYRFYAVGHNDAKNNIGFALTTNSSGTHAVRIQNTLAYYAGSGSTFASDLYSDIVLGQPVELKLSTKGGVMNAYVNGKKVADYAMGTEAYGKAAFNIDVDCEGDAIPTATLSDYVMTKAVEITDLAVGNISITNADGSAIGDSINGNVNVKVPVCNGSGIEKDVYVVLAFYDGTKMTNCFVAPANTRKVSARDFVTIPFENKAPNGGTKLKVFVWDNTTNLIPYIDNIEFPAAS